MASITMATVLASFIALSSVESRTNRIASFPEPLRDLKKAIDKDPKPLAFQDKAHCDAVANVLEYDCKGAMIMYRLPELAKAVYDGEVLAGFAGTLNETLSNSFGLKLIASGIAIPLALFQAPSELTCGNATCNTFDLSRAIDASIMHILYEGVDIKLQAEVGIRGFEAHPDQSINCPPGLETYTENVPSFDDASGILRRILDSRTFVFATADYDYGIEVRTNEYGDENASSYWPRWIQAFCSQFNGLKGKDGKRYDANGTIACPVQLHGSYGDVFSSLLKGEVHATTPWVAPEWYNGTSQPCTSDNQTKACWPKGHPLETCNKDGVCALPSPILRTRYFDGSCYVGELELTMMVLPAESPPFLFDYKVVLLIVALLVSLLMHALSFVKSNQVTSKLPGTDDVIFPNRSVMMLDGNNASDVSRVQEALSLANKYIVAFVNQGSGDQRGAEDFLQYFRFLLGDYGRVFGLPQDLDAGFQVAAEKVSRGAEDVVVLACGGDGTVSWILAALEQQKGQLFPADELPSVGIVPLGTGNDLARSLGWGPCLNESTELPDYIVRATFADTVLLDQWRLQLQPKSLLPPSLLASANAEFTGYFTNYFSIGMDATMTYEVGRARHEGIGKWLFQRRCCHPCRFIHGGMLCYVLNAPNILRCLCCRIKPLNPQLNVKLDGAEEPLLFDQGEFRQFTLANLNSYGSGMQLYSADDIRTTVSPADGKLEAFTWSGPHAMGVATIAKKVCRLPCGSTKIYQQPQRVELQLKKGQFFQMDGEPWLLNTGCSAVIELNANVRVLCPPTKGPGAGIWSGPQKRDFWEGARVDIGPRPKSSYLELAAVAGSSQLLEPNVN